MLMIAGLSSLFGYNGQAREEQRDSEMDAMNKFAEAFQNRPIYKRLTAEILQAVPDDQLEQTVFDNIYEIIGEDYENELQNVQRLTKGQQAIFSTWIVEGEVNNGGFNQFYFNSSGQYANMAVEGFETVGAIKFAHLMKEANKLYASINGDLEKFDDGTLESFSESYNENPLNELDDKFYDLDEAEPLWKSRVRYIRAHIDQFVSSEAHPAK